MFRAAIPVLHLPIAALFGILTALQPAPEPRASGTVLAAFPASPDPSLRYVVYLHGRIVEEQGRRAKSPEYGAYEYDAILQALARPGMAVIGEIRAKDADPKASAQHVVEATKRLIDAGVPARNITVIGASKGALIAMLASTALSNEDVGWVIMANCNDWVTKNYDVALHGQVLSIFESSDEVGGTCAPIFEQSRTLAGHDEVRLDTGLGHGYLYRPLREWVEPTIAWIRDRKR